jgi:hypothetical protein
MKHEWSTREDWARRRRSTAYAGHNPHPASSALADYADPDEVQEAVRVAGPVLRKLRNDENPRPNTPTPEHTLRA